MTRDELAALKERIDCRPIVASFSGGKDSTAMCLHLIELGLDFTPVFMDTGWEHQATYDYVASAHKWLGRDVVTLRSEKHPGGFEAMVRAGLAFPSRRMRFCTWKLKVEPMQAFIQSLDDEPLNAVGIRAGESVARSKMPPWERWDAADCDVWRPILRWSEQDVIDTHRRHGVIPNSLYLKGAERVGCWPCIMSRKSEIRLIAEIDPPRIDQIAALERDVTAAVKASPDHMAKIRRRAEERASDGRLERCDIDAEIERVSRRTFFHTGTNEAGIRDVVEWSKTSYGGRQYMLFDDAEPGCMRWGLCEHPEAAGGGE